MVFSLPAEAGEKVGLGINSMLAMMVFLMAMTENLPPTKKLPLAGMLPAFRSGLCRYFEEGYFIIFKFFLIQFSWIAISENNAVICTWIYNDKFIHACGFTQWYCLPGVYYGTCITIITFNIIFSVAVMNLNVMGMRGYQVPEPLRSVILFLHGRKTDHVVNYEILLVCL